MYIPALFPRAPEQNHYSHISSPSPPLQEGIVGRLMEMPADFAVPRHGVDLADRIAPRTRRLRSLVGFLDEVIKLKGVPANNTCAKIMGFYGLLKAIRMEELDVGPRFEFVYTVIDAGLQSLKCVLLMYVVLSDMPWSVALLCILMAVLFIAK